MSTVRSHLQLDGQLPTGRFAIEASAGTGKTFTLSTLAARYVVERGFAISEILVVTFTRAAAAELEDRIRLRLVDFARVLSMGGRDAASVDDPVLAMISDVDDDERSVRLARARAAVTDFDAATITTIHGFVNQALRSLGSSASVDPDAVLVDDNREMIVQVVADVYVGLALSGSLDALPSVDVATRLAMTTLGNPGARPVPTSDMAGAVEDPVMIAACERQAMIDTLCVEVQRRRRDSGSMSFADTLVVLRDALVDPLGGPALSRILRRRFPVVMIDEFQDTDPVQWEIFDTAFGAHDDEAESTLIIVGDPKQAIYAFRGANVHTYLQAVSSKGTVTREMDTNWRSDPRALDALDVLFDGSTFGDDAIRFQHVKHAPRNADSRLADVDGRELATLSVRLADGTGIVRRKAPSCLATTDAKNSKIIYHDLVVHLRELFETALIPDGPAGRHPRPDDVAVLVRTGYEARDIQKVLISAGIPAVIARGDNVMRSNAAQQWFTLFRALAAPTVTSRARTFAIGWFGGRDLVGVADLEDSALVEIQERLREWGDVLISQGTAAFVGRVRVDSGVVGRVLSRPDGDRCMTDLDHIAELLVQATPGRTTPAGLLASLTELAAGGTDSADLTDPTSRRIESDGRAVQIMTIFGAKGLEFPIVCAPTMWSMRSTKPDDHVWWDSTRGARMIDMASSMDWHADTDRNRRAELTLRDIAGTDLRLLYVALTRARHHTALWWLPTDGATRSGLARVLFARGADGGTDPDMFMESKIEIRHGDDAVAFLEPLVARSDGSIEVTLVNGPATHLEMQAVGRDDGQVSLDVARVTTPLRNTRRWSFSLLTSGVDGHDEPVDEPRAAPTDDEDPGRGDLTREPLPLGAIAGGAGFGTLVHSVFEQVDFTVDDLRGELARAIDREIVVNPWEVDRGELVEGLVAVIETPVGPLFAGGSMRSLARTDRLDELAFELTLARGGAATTMRAIGEVLVAGLDVDDPMSGWADALRDGVFEVDLAGHLTGSIDLLARIRRDGSPDSFVICDYKTNRLGPTSRPATASDYAPACVTAEMERHHYALQALLYSVATHRYLRWRVTDYDPAVHLGGVGYLFVRGMAGPSTVVHDGVPTGVFEWHPPASVIESVSDLLDGVSE